jgi:hypothetical protein
MSRLSGRLLFVCSSASASTGRCRARLLVLVGEKPSHYRLAPVEDSAAYSHEGRPDAALAPADGCSFGNSGEPSKFRLGHQIKIKAWGFSHKSHLLMFG